VISPHAIGTVKLSMADIPFCEVVTDGSDNLALKIFPDSIF
jgi:hypothetical protein